jgi:hypothetical protein
LGNVDVNVDNTGIKETEHEDVDWIQLAQDKTQ